MSNLDIKISVVVPVYNVENYLEVCLKSIVGQSYQNLEIILIDDGSTDCCPEICDRYAKLDGRIRVIHKLNGGVSAARNAGLEHCTGEYISFVDGDDWLEPDMYKTLVGGLTAADVDISACGYFEDYGEVHKPVENRLPVPEDRMDIRDFLKYIYIRDQYRGVAGYLWNKIIRSEVIRENKLRFFDLPVGEDQIFAAQCFVQSRKIVYTGRPLYHYVQRADSAMHDRQKRLHSLGSCKAFQMIIDLYEKNGIDSTVVDYVKRFYVFHSLKLLKIALECGETAQVPTLRTNIDRYFDVYCKTNFDCPTRIEEAQLLIKRAEEAA